MLLTVDETRKVLKLSTATIYRHIKSGQFKKVKLGGSTRIELPPDLESKYKEQILALTS
ncbi:helix-turn-helix domain-containing protein [Acinetobacter dispersus]|uniref:helix-turn-helix domain-containing protein n=1 Tax=Acinetobacter dispersus TaxID=70348 RepID=UPI001F4A2E89|nr:helix-turn-helix domain-containing protein [Acinetobacter dispersus]MCH7393783.1 helix-turn-helix domain-containing protein [Acinetobacter dispersus]